MAGSHQSGLLPCLALCGEFSAGKSSIVNLLLGCDTLPTSVLSSTRRPTYLRYATDLRIEAISESGERELVSPATIAMLSREDISHFDVGMPSELLRQPPRSIGSQQFDRGIRNFQSPRARGDPRTGFVEQRLRRQKATKEGAGLVEVRNDLRVALEPRQAERVLVVPIFGRPDPAA